jgi:hypothetical protein
MNFWTIKSSTLSSRRVAMKPDTEPEFISFEASFEACPPGTLATPRPPGRPRGTETGIGQEGILISFEPAEPDAAFAQELAGRVREYVRSRSVSGLTAEQLAALVQQLLARRSA